MKIEWNELPASNKALLIIRIAASIAVLVCAFLGMTGAWENANNFTVPLLGVVVLVQSIQEWKDQKRKAAIFGFCVAAFSLLVTVSVFFL